MNIASLSYHFEELESLLSLLDTKFDIIGITETKLQVNDINRTNINLKNYSFEQTPTESNKGGSLLYISSKYNYKKRTDLNIYKSRDLESTFVELLNPKAKNTIIGVSTNIHQ